MRIDDQRFDFTRQISHPFDVNGETVSADRYPVNQYDSSWPVAAPIVRVSTDCQER